MIINITASQEFFNESTRTVTLHRDNMETLEDLAYFFQDAANVIGFTYVTSVAISTENGSTISSDL
jgi:hypothetical protein